MAARFTVTTTATPEQVLGAFTDVGPHRLDVWRRTLDPAKYELREQGDGWAVVREGSAGTRLWVVLRYEWAPGAVRWSLVDSDHCRSGRGEIVITPREGGSTLRVLIDHHEPRGLRGRVVLLLQRLLAPVLFPRLWRTALDRLPAAAA
jgi:Polyketide cyclase / dehydrase and lipid transport